MMLAMADKMQPMLERMCGADKAALVQKCVKDKTGVDVTTVLANRDAIRTDMCKAKEQCKAKTETEFGVGICDKCHAAMEVNKTACHKAKCECFEEKIKPTMTTCAAKVDGLKMPEWMSMSCADKEKKMAAKHAEMKAMHTDFCAADFTWANVTLPFMHHHHGGHHGEDMTTAQP